MTKILLPPSFALSLVSMSCGSIWYISGLCFQTVSLFMALAPQPHVTPEIQSHLIGNEADWLSFLASHVAAMWMECQRCSHVAHFRVCGVLATTQPRQHPLLSWPGHMMQEGCTPQILGSQERSRDSLEPLYPALSAASTVSHSPTSPARKGGWAGRNSLGKGQVRILNLLTKM